MYLRFDDENPSKFPAVLTFPVRPNGLVWTKDRQTISTRRGYIVCRTNYHIGAQIAVYPLVPDKTKPPCSFVACLPDHWLVSHPGSHVVFRHESVCILRPVHGVFWRAYWAAKNQSPVLMDRLITLVKHCYLNDIINDALLDQYSHSMERIENILLRAEGTTYEGESEVAYRMFHRETRRFLGKIKKEIGL